VNDRQYIEVSPVLKDPNTDKLIHIGFETTNARDLRDYLESKGVAVPENIQTGPDGNLSFTISDPDGTWSNLYSTYRTRSKAGVLASSCQTPVSRTIYFMSASL